MLENVCLSLSEILGVFVNTLTTDNRYSYLNRNNLPEAIQLQLSKKQKIFTYIFAAYLISTSNVQHFAQKHDPHKFCIFEIRDCKRCG